MELNIGAKIKKLRLARGLTQEQLAELLNVSGAAISKWEAILILQDYVIISNTWICCWNVVKKSNSSTRQNAERREIYIRKKP